MSSVVGGGAFVAAAVAAPVVAGAAVAGAAIYGAGYALFQGGKLIADGIIALHDMAEEQKKRAEAERAQKLNAARSAYSGFSEACAKAIGELEASGDATDAALASSLRGVKDPPPSDDPAAMYIALADAQAKLDNALRRSKKLTTMRIAQKGIEKSTDMATVLAGIRASVVSASMSGDLGDYVPEIVRSVSADTEEAAQIQYRADLLRRLNDVAASVVVALDEIDEISEYFGRNDASANWFRSCFGGADRQIKGLLSPTISDDDLANGVEQLEASYKSYELTRANIMSSISEKKSNYDAYCQIAAALAEPVLEISDFSSADDIAKKVRSLDSRRKLAEKRREMYQHMGRDAYISYAWEQELTKLGYTVLTKDNVESISQEKLTHVILDEKELPIYELGNGDKAQYYRVSDTCILQFILHADGSVSMETISAENADTVPVQIKHCALMARLAEKLRENWFIIYNGDEIEGATQIYTENMWRKKAPRKRTRRTEDKKQAKVMHIDGN